MQLNGELDSDMRNLNQDIFNAVFDDMIPKGAVAIHVKDENSKNAERSNGDKLCRGCGYFSDYSINNKAVEKRLVNKRAVRKKGKEKV